MYGRRDPYHETRLPEMQPQYADQFGFQTSLDGLLDHQADFEDRAENDVEGLGSRLNPTRLIGKQS